MQYQNHQSLLVRASKVRPSLINYLWFPAIAEGEVTVVIDGAPSGASHLTSFLAAAISTGGLLPGNDRPISPKQVILIASRPAIFGNIWPELVAAKADLNRVNFLRDKHGKIGFREIDLNADIDQLRDAVHDSLAELVVIELHRYNFTLAAAEGLKAFTTALRKLARSLAVAIVVIVVCRGSSTSRQTRKAIAKLSRSKSVGAVGTIEPAKVDHCLRFRGAKQIGGHAAHDITFRVVSRAMAPGLFATTLVWEPPALKSSTRGTMPKVASVKKPRNARGKKLRRAKEWLIKSLENGPQPSVQLPQRAAAEGIKAITLRRAADGLGVKKTARQWRLPTNEVPAAPHGDR